jgi:ribosomal protein S18 acetylase RimI-like enzyme
MYRQLAEAPDCFGFVALHQGVVEGIVVGVPANGGVLRRVIWRSGTRLLVPLLGAVTNRPSLLARAWETLSYGRQFAELPEEAELLFIGVRPGEHGQGIGRSLFRALAESARQRGMRWLTLTVDDANERAQTFYQRNGMHVEAPLVLYGRPMHRYVLGLVAEEDQ